MLSYDFMASEGWLRQYDELADKHGWPRRGEDGYEENRDAYVRFQHRYRETQRATKARREGESGEWKAKPRWRRLVGSGGA